MPVYTVSLCAFLHAGWRSRVKSALYPVVTFSSRVAALDTGTWVVHRRSRSLWCIEHCEHCVVGGALTDSLQLCVFSAERLQKRWWNKVPKLREILPRSTGLNSYLLFNLNLIQQCIQGLQWSNYYPTNRKTTWDVMRWGQHKLVARLEMWNFRNSDSKWITSCPCQSNLVDYVAHVLTACSIVGRQSFGDEHCLTGWNYITREKMPSGFPKNSDIWHCSGLALTKLSIWNCLSNRVGKLSYHYDHHLSPGNTAFSGQNQVVSEPFVTSQRSALQNCEFKQKKVLERAGSQKSKGMIAW